MSYQKLNLQTGQVLTADALNHIEDGILETSTYEQEVTYEELMQLQAAGELVPNRVYHITDYEASLNDDYINSGKARLTPIETNGYQFDILVRAISHYELSEEARICAKQNSGFFANDLYRVREWKIRYIAKPNVAKLVSDWGSPTGKGVIVRMEDPFGNVTPYDRLGIQVGIRETPTSEPEFLFAFPYYNQIVFSRVCRNVRISPYSGKQLPRVVIQQTGFNADIHECDDIKLVAVSDSEINNIYGLRGIDISSSRITDGSDITLTSLAFAHIIACSILVFENRTINIDMNECRKLTIKGRETNGLRIIDTYKGLRESNLLIENPEDHSLIVANENDYETISNRGL